MESKLLVMPIANPDPINLNAVWKAVHQTEKQIEDIWKVLSKPTLWARAWNERVWLVPTLLVVLGGLGTGTYKLAGWWITTRISIGTEPINAKLERIKEDSEKIRETLAVLQAQIAAQKYSTLAPKELKNHRDELKQIKSSLVQAQPTALGYWPVAFQIITLTSKTNLLDVQKILSQPEGLMSDVRSSSPGAIAVPPGSRIVLKNRVEGIIFRNSIIRFDSSVLLVNDIFIDCVFVFPVEDNPPRPLREIGRALLASDLSQVTLNAS